MGRPSVVCFDLGGVLVRICRSWREACIRANLPLRDPTWVGSQPALARRREVVFAYQRGELTSVDYCREMSQALGCRYSETEVEQVHDAWLVDEYQGVRALVEELGQTPGLRTACLSNTNERHWQALASEDTTPAFPSVMALHARFASHLLGASKPEPEIYRAFEQKFGAQPEQIVFFDDTEENVEMARSLGWCAECVDPNSETEPQLRRCLAELGLVSGAAS